MLTVEPHETGERADRWLAKRLPELSRARLQALIKDARIRCGRETLGEASRRVKPGEMYEVQLPAVAPSGIAGEAIALNIVFEDSDVIVIDKPAGLVVHPAAGHASGTLVNALIAHCGDSLSGIGGVARPGIVHRLDKDTSGLLVVAKTDRAHHSLSEQFKSHGADGRLHRIYRALVWGVPLRKDGVIDAPLGRSLTNRMKIAVTRAAAGRHAVTHYTTLGTFAGADGTPAVSLLELRLETGRTHQIRVHLAHIGHPVLGDQVYGAGFKSSAERLRDPAKAALAALRRQALHAAGLAFEHPRSKRMVTFDSPFPDDIQTLVNALTTGGAAQSTVKPRTPRRPR